MDNRGSPGQGSQRETTSNIRPSMHRTPQREEEDLDLSQDAASRVEGLDLWGEVVDDVVVVEPEVEEI